MEFNPKEDAQNLHAYISGKTKDEEKLINLVTNRTNEERLKIKDEYNSSFNSDLIKDLEKEFSHHFKDVLVGLFYDPIDFDCYHIRKAVKGLGTDEDALIEILATRTPEAIEQMKERYKILYPGRDMVNDIKNDTSGSFLNILLALLTYKRSSNESPDKEECINCAKALYEATQTKKNYVEVFTKIFTEKSLKEVQAIGALFYKMTKINILDQVKKLFSGDTKNALLGIIYGMLSPSEYFAMRVNDSIKGLGTKDTKLIRILISRDEIDMPQIKDYYKRLYKKDMIEDIKGDTSGNYRKILIELATH
jgi:annexin A7/11